MKNNLIRARDVYPQRTELPNVQIESEGKGSKSKTMANRKNSVLLRIRTLAKLTM